MEIEYLLISDDVSPIELIALLLIRQRTSRLCSLFHPGHLYRCPNVVRRCGTTT